MSSSATPASRVSAIARSIVDRSLYTGISTVTSGAASVTGRVLPSPVQMSFAKGLRPSVPIACGLLAAALSIGAMIPSLRPMGWSLTALPRVDSASGMGAAARARDPGFRTVDAGAYDGQFYWGIAVDPIATGNVHQSFDDPPYRYGHPLYGWLGWVLSAGQARAAPAALAVVGVISMVAAALAAGALAVRGGRLG